LNRDRDASPQPGNLPRLFRLPEQRALVNRMGFLVKALNISGRLRLTHRFGAVNLQEQSTPLENAFEDYLIWLKSWFAVDYLAPR
jgi:dihydroorotate dehydrogenase